MSYVVRSAGRGLQRLRVTPPGLTPPTFQAIRPLAESLAQGELERFPEPNIEVQAVDKTLPAEAYEQLEYFVDLTGVVKHVQAPIVAVPEIDYRTATDASIVRIWEGVVLDFDEKLETLHVQLHAMSDDVPDHVGEISLDLVSEQDRELVKAGAVFYLTIFNQRRAGGTIVNSQELQFRRRPAWTRQQVQTIKATAESLLKKMHVRPAAE